MNCQDQIYSEEYIDFIGNRSLIESKYTLDCKQPLGARFASLYLKLSDGYEDGTVYGYYNIPKLFGLQDTGSMESSGILQVRENSDLKLDGSGVLIGFVDTGIDYAGSIFLKQDGTTRVTAIWDQTIPAEAQSDCLRSQSFQRRQRTLQERRKDFYMEANLRMSS